MSQNQADDEALADVTKLLAGLHKRLDKIGSFWFERIVAGVIVLIMLLAGWVWTQERRMNRLEDTYRLERDAAIDAAIDQLRRELSR